MRRSDFTASASCYYEMLTVRSRIRAHQRWMSCSSTVNAPLPMLPKALVRHEPVLLKMMAVT